MMSTAIMRCPARADIAARALDLTISQLRAAIALRGEAHLALTGGSSAAALFDRFVGDESSRRVGWQHVHVWQGDERFVPRDHPDSNWAGAQRDWLDHAQGPRPRRDHLHPIPVDEAIIADHHAEWAAATYSAEIERTLGRRARVPSFDVFLLGVGGDGHIMSTFPGSAAISGETHPALAVDAPTHIEPHLPRVTLAPFLLPAAGLVVVMVPGAGKADVMAKILGNEHDPMRWPAQLALLPNAVWLLEPDSAARL
ncbi:MAG: 6-phosphogluconolactonase [Chloroflexota bacterium]